MSSTPTLYQQLDELAVWMETADSLEAGDPQLEEIAARIQQLVNGSHEKVDAIHRALCMLESVSAAADPEIKRLVERKAAAARQANRLKEYVIAAMTQFNLTRIDGRIVTFSVRPSPPAVEVLDATTLPAAYTRISPVTYSPDKEAIARALKAGGEVPGCRLRQGKTLVRR